MSDEIKRRVRPKYPNPVCVERLLSAVIRAGRTPTVLSIATDGSLTFDFEKRVDAGATDFDAELQAWEATYAEG